MLDFDRDHFEQLMSEAVILHNQHEYEAALVLSTEAHKIAPYYTFEKGRAARDNAARNDRLGRTEEAEIWAEEAYDMHNGIVQRMGQYTTREALRERAMSAMYVGVVGLRKYFSDQASEDPVTDPSTFVFMEQAWLDLQEAKLQATGINRRIDQYEINAARRVSITESLMGDRKFGMLIGTRAVALAFMSESPRLDTSNPNMTHTERLKAKLKALMGGVAAVGINLIATPKNGTRRQLALQLASRTL